MYKITLGIIILFSLLSSTIEAQDAISAKLHSINNDSNITPPTFQTGDEALYSYLSNNITYPPILIKIKLEGSLDLKFTVDKNGKVKNVEILRGFDPDADSEVIRALEKMPTWNPAKEDTKNIDYTYNLTITFKLTNELIENSKKIEVNPIKSIEVEKPMEKAIEKELKQVTIEIKEDSLNHSPQFPGGEEALNAFLKQHLKYPKKAIDHGIEGRVIFNLEISDKGKITTITLSKGLFYECNQEAFYLIKQMPDWVPGLKDGKPTKMSVLVPIPFVLPK